MRESRLWPNRTLCIDGSFTTRMGGAGGSWCDISAIQSQWLMVCSGKTWFGLRHWWKVKVRRRTAVVERGIQPNMHWMCADAGKLSRQLQRSVQGNLGSQVGRSSSQRTTTSYYSCKLRKRWMCTLSYKNVQLFDVLTNSLNNRPVAVGLICTQSESVR